MKWMKPNQYPTLPGFYWVDRGEPFRSRGEACMTEFRTMPDGTLRWRDDGHFIMRCDQEIRFAGPIPEPEGGEDGD
jgi:hypothetical protein